MDREKNWYDDLSDYAEHSLRVWWRYHDMPPKGYVKKAIKAHWIKVNDVDGLTPGVFAEICRHLKVEPDNIGQIADKIPKRPEIDRALAILHRAGCRYLDPGLSRRVEF